MSGVLEADRACRGTPARSSSSPKMRERLPRLISSMIRTKFSSGLRPARSHISHEDARLHVVRELPVGRRRPAGSPPRNPHTHTTGETARSPPADRGSPLSGVLPDIGRRVGKNVFPEPGGPSKMSCFLLRRRDSISARSTISHEDYVLPTIGDLVELPRRTTFWPSLSYQLIDAEHIPSRHSIGAWFTRKLVPV